jgi:hypothetical protein
MTYANKIETRETETPLFIVISISVLIALLGSLGLLPSYTAWTTSSERRSKSEVDVLLRIKTDDKGWNVDHLLSDSVKLLDPTNDNITLN